MALKMEIEKTSFGFSLPEAYVRISEITGNKTALFVTVMVHASAEAREKKFPPIEVWREKVDTAKIAGPLLPALYSHLKTLPKYEYSEDC